MFETMLRAVFVVAAVLRAAARVAYLEPRTDLPELVSRLRAAKVSRGLVASSLLAEPRLTLGLVERILPVLPPFGAGRCMKRSLLLLDLWSRLELAPSLHFGVRSVGSDRSGHAWVETKNVRFRTFRSPGVVEAWRA